MSIDGDFCKSNFCYFVKHTYKTPVEAAKNIDKENTMFQLALGLVNQSKRNIFLTGKAGTGKTTFLRYIREHSAKQLAVVAPTGVAAINAGGVTIHSFFQLPLGPFIPDAKHGFAPSSDEVTNTSALLGRLRMTRDKIRVFEELELLVIDEISMVRADTLDAIDTVLRHTRKRPGERFGGVQILFIGDMFQLPPVTREDVWRWLSEYYKSPYFFDSHVLQDDPPLYVEFNKVYRQNEEQFIRLLNQVRNDELDEDGFAILEQRFLPDFVPQVNDGYIILTTHNDIVKRINTVALQRLRAQHYSFIAEVSGEFPDSSFPADETLVLCEGAQVMFIKNDTERKRFFNGKIGFVSRIEKDKIWVLCNQEEIEVKREKWENIRYIVNASNRLLEEETLGSFSQFPLRLAWAITIHKSQGLTFERAIVDAGKAFAPGQVYVALSRCTSLDGLVLKSRINSASLRNDPRIAEFAGTSASAEALRAQLDNAAQTARQDFVFEAFDFKRESEALVELVLFIRKHASSFHGDSTTWLEKLGQRIGSIRETGLKFHEWIRQQVLQEPFMELNTVLAERVKRASVHFNGELRQLINLLKECSLTTSNKANAREVNERIRELFAMCSLHSYLLENFSVEMDLNEWQQKKRSFLQPLFSVNVFSGSDEATKSLMHPGLYKRLKKLRDSISTKREMPIYLIAGSKTLEELANYLPQTEDELVRIKGFGKVKVQKFGSEFLEIIRNYCSENGLSSNMEDMASSPEAEAGSNAKGMGDASEIGGGSGSIVKRGGRKKFDSRAESFRMYSSGMTPGDIASLRGLTVQTIEGHLAHYVEAGEILIDRLVSEEKREAILKAAGSLETPSLGAIKGLVGDAVSFGEIRLVLAWRKGASRE